MSLRWKVTLSLAGLAAVIAIGASVGAYLTAAGQLTRSVDDSLIAMATTLKEARQGPNGPGGSRFNNLCPRGAEFTTAMAVQAVLASGVAVQCDTSEVDLPINHHTLDLATGASTTATLTSIRLRDEPARMIEVPVNGGAVQIARGLGEANAVLEQLGVRLFFIGSAAVLLAAAIGRIFANRLTRPIRALQRSAETIAETRNFAVDLPTAGKDEVGSLTESFRTMVDSLATSLEQQRRLVSDASHEMRTPLTSLRTNLEHLERAKTLPHAEQLPIFNDLSAEVTELSELVAEMVELAADPTRVTELPTITDLGELARPVVDRAERRSGRTITLEVIDATALAVPVSRIERVVSNLVDNALKYGGDAPIEVTVLGAHLTVRDHGEGINPADLPRLFDRFYRADEARTKPGSGLGLAIVQQIVDSVGGTITAANHPDQGAVFSLDLTNSISRDDET